MSRFDELMDEFVFHAKNAADIAGKKTGEVVEASKLRYQIKQTEWEIEKTYGKLGAIVYESKRSTEDFSEIIALAMEELDALVARKADLEERLLSFRRMIRCTSCGQENETSASFCSRCGTAIIPTPSYQAYEEPQPEEAPEEQEDNFSL